MPVGRPPKITDLVLAKLEQAFLMGCTDKEACLYADIVPSTLYRYQEENPEFTERKETLKQNPVMKARGVVLDALGENDIHTAHKVIERKDGTKVKNENTGPDGGPQEHKWSVEVVDKTGGE